MFLLFVFGFLGRYSCLLAERINRIHDMGLCASREALREKDRLLEQLEQQLDGLRKENRGLTRRIEANFDEAGWLKTLLGAHGLP